MNFTCCICLEALSQSPTGPSPSSENGSGKGTSEMVNVAVTPCGHVFHSPCLLRWVKAESGKCPCCRELLNAKDLLELVKRGDDDEEENERNESAKGVAEGNGNALRELIIEYEAELESREASITNLRVEVALLRRDKILEEHKHSNEVKRLLLRCNILTKSRDKTFMVLQAAKERIKLFNTQMQNLQERRQEFEDLQRQKATTNARGVQGGSSAPQNQGLTKRAAPDSPTPSTSTSVAPPKRKRPMVIESDSEDDSGTTTIQSREENPSPIAGIPVPIAASTPLMPCPRAKKGNTFKSAICSCYLGKRPLCLDCNRRVQEMRFE